MREEVCSSYGIGVELVNREVVQAGGKIWPPQVVNPGGLTVSQVQEIAFAEIDGCQPTAWCVGIRRRPLQVFMPQARREIFAFDDPDGVHLAGLEWPIQLRLDRGGCRVLN